jgi:hypothetical protein
MNFWIGNQSGKQFRCGPRPAGYHSGDQAVFENQDLARDFAEFADVMSVLLNSRRAAARQSVAGPETRVAVRFASQPRH